MPNVAGSINNRGEVAGTAQSPLDGTIHAFLWTKDEGMQDFGAFPGAFATVPPCCHSINDSGGMVGFSIDGDGNMRALLWQGKVPKDLNTFIAKKSGWYLLAASSINDAGQIVGWGTINGEVHALLATPCDRNHAGSESCEDDAEGAAAEADETTVRPQPVLSEDARKLLQQRFGRFGVPLTGPR